MMMMMMMMMMINIIDGDDDKDVILPCMSISEYYLKIIKFNLFYYKQFDCMFNKFI